MKNVLCLLTLLFLLACQQETDLQPKEDIQPSVDVQTNQDLLTYIHENYSEYLFDENEEGVASDRNGNGSIAINEPIRLRIDGDFTDIVYGHCSIIRTKHGTHVSLHVSDLVPGEIANVTLFAINYDEDCDFLPGFSTADLIQLGEPVVNPAGKVNFNYFLANGDNTNSLFPFPTQGVVKATQADIVVRLREGGLPDGHDLFKGSLVCP